MPINIKDKLKAFSVHLSVSAVLTIILVCIILFSWFPNEFVYAGGVTGLKIIIGVDLVLGPVLTFIVFNKNKFNLKFDLAIICIIQISCMAGGVWLMQKERPIAQVIAEDGIHIITKGDLDLYKVKIEPQSNGIQPQFLMMDLPEDWSQIPALKVATEFMQEKPFVYRQDLYINIEDVTSNAFLERIQKIQSTSTKNINNSKSIEYQCDWIPVISNHNSGEACVNLKKGIVLLSNKNL